MTTNTVLSNVGSIHLGADESQTDPFDTISGQFTWVVRNLPNDASLYIEQTVHPTGRIQGVDQPVRVPRHRPDRADREQGRVDAARDAHGHVPRVGFRGRRGVLRVPSGHPVPVAAPSRSLQGERIGLLKVGLGAPVPRNAPLKSTEPTLPVPPTTGEPQGKATCASTASLAHWSPKRAFDPTCREREP